jgi:hypothetical protein
VDNFETLELIAIHAGLDEWKRRRVIFVSNPHFIPKTTKQKMNNAIAYLSSHAF